ncbi:hypothetical protein HY375_01860 [Candidatus Berkelbacteria bacterium]|nr:hypothetical protein [Candidatus Berkelbacteria bacterium]
MRSSPWVYLWIVLAILLLGWIAWDQKLLPTQRDRDTTPVPLAEGTSTTSSAVTSAGTSTNRTTINLRTNGQETHAATITLTPVAGRTGSGSATRTYVNGRFDHTVTASLPSPATGRFYEGWLTDGSRVLSTGRLERTDDDTYRLTYNSSEDLRGLTRVVITEETEIMGLDGITEDHVVEGTFKEEE